MYLLIDVEDEIFIDLISGGHATIAKSALSSTYLILAL